MNDTGTNFTIGTLAQAAEMNVETIRYYQRRGLMPAPARQHGHIRRYGNKELDRLYFIRRAQQLGFSLDDIGQLLELDDGLHCKEAQQLGRQHLMTVRKKIDHLQHMARALTNLIANCETEEGNQRCPLISALYGSDRIDDVQVRKNRTISDDS